MYEDIKEQFISVIQYSQRISDPQIDKLFDSWKTSKDKFIKLFRGLIYECPEEIEFTLSKEIQNSRAMQFSDFVYDSFNNEELSMFLDKNLDGFYDNKVINGDGVVPKGMKLIKAFKFFEKDKNKLHKIQDMASQLVQENKIKGKLCFSVHPLDFLSSSENTYNWRSCHALNGDYRAGNLSYMVDEVTFMVYLKGEDNVILDSFGDDVPWNSKKWRTLMHISPNDCLMFAGRQYPFSSITGLDKVLEIFNYLLNRDEIDDEDLYYLYPKKFTSWENRYINFCIDKDTDEKLILNGKHIYLNGDIFKIDQIVHQHCMGLNYNDILHSTCYEYPFYAYKGSFNKLIITEQDIITLGGPVKCLHCGKELITSPNSMRCDHCEIEYGYEDNDDIGICACCGTRLWLDDAACVEPYEEYVCQRCMEQECFVCDQCGNVYYKNEMKYIDGSEGWYCRECYEEAREQVEEIRLQRETIFKW